LIVCSSDRRSTSTTQPQQHNLRSINQSSCAFSNNMAHLLNTTFGTRTKTHNWTALLAYLQEQSGPPPNLKIWTQPVTYTDGKQKKAYLDAAKGTPEFSDYDNCKTVPTAVKQYTSGPGTVFLFIVNADPAAEKKKNKTLGKKKGNNKLKTNKPKKDSNWHSMVVCIKDGVVAIYDPSYIANKAVAIPQVASLRNMNLVMNFLRTLRKKGYTVSDYVFVSGGGNDGRKCNEMCRLWLIDQLIIQGGRNIWNWEALGWDKYTSR
jgi:hypothetical protein